MTAIRFRSLTTVSQFIDARGAPIQRRGKWCSAGSLKWPDYATPASCEAFSLLRGLAILHGRNDAPEGTPQIAFRKVEPRAIQLGNCFFRRRDRGKRDLLVQPATAFRPASVKPSAVGSIKGRNDPGAGSVTAIGEGRSAGSA
jgi:hypothetical protein